MILRVRAGPRTSAATVDHRCVKPRSHVPGPRTRPAARPPGYQTPCASTKPALAARMIGRAVDAGIRAPWVAGDEVRGSNPHLRTTLEQRQLGYVVAIACDHQITTPPAGRVRADALIKRFPKRVWQKLSTGAGAKGHRYYDWSLTDFADEGPGHHQLLVRRNRSTGELALYRCHLATHVPLSTFGDGGRTQMESKRPSSPERAWPDWTNTRSDAGRPGTVGSPS
ncbi:transposase [Streptomyces sp. NPDC058287]|uniref:transposase n=1 Tax=unclassified Streptomyces TaxID=2593676 RepID=UPI0036E28C73